MKKYLMNLNFKFNFNKKYIIYVLAFSPIIDIIYTILYKFLEVDIPIQQILRILILVYMILSINNKKYKVILMGLVTILSVGQIYIYFNEYPFSIVNNFSFILKIMSLYSIIFFIKEGLEEETLKVWDVLYSINISAIIISLNIIIANIFKIGLKTYNYGGREGYKGFIDAHNDITAVLLVILPISIYIFYKNKKKINLLTPILISISLVMIGTKAGKALLIFELSLLSIMYIIKNKNVFLRFKNVFIFAMVIISLLIYTNFDYLQKEMLLKVQDKGYKSIYSYVVSYRNIQPILINNNIAEKHNIHPKYQFGMGYYYANKVLNEEKEEFHMIENDVDGLIYYTGLATASILIYLLLAIIIKILKSNFGDKYLKSMLIVSIILAAIHSFLGGHVLYSAIGNTYFGAILGVGYYLSNKTHNTNSNRRRI